MRIALVTTQVPFVRGGAELLAESLKRELIRHNHDCEIVSLPFNWHPAEKLADSMLAAGMIDLADLGGHPIDLVIGLKFPAWLVRHPRKRFWIVHQHRQAYDHWELGSSDLLRQKDGRTVRAAIHDADRKAFGGHDVFTISRNVSDRLERFLGIPSEPLYHPPPIADFLTPGSAEDFLLAPSRLSPPKRQDLILQALAKTREPVRVVFVGAPDSDAFGNRLRALAAELDLEDRVEWRSGLAPEALADLYARARGVVFVPQDEDYGYVTLEAMLAAKPVITTSDAGGPLEFVVDGETGHVSQPEAAPLARILDSLWADPDRAAILGQAGLARYHQMKIGWEAVLDGLVGPSQSVATDSSEQALPSRASTRPSPPLASGWSFTPNVDAVIQRAGVGSMDELLDAYRFTGVNQEVRAYLKSHWLRYLQTAALLPDIPHMRVLDLGAGKPHAFPGLVKLIYPYSTFEAVTEARQEASGRERFPATKCGADLEIATRSFNLEIDDFPYPDASFDVVLAMEVLEHLALNPARMFAEVARVLRPGGSFIVTTPNITSDAALKKLFSGHAPYSFGVFIPYHGVYGRHNREYTPHEVEALGKMSGLSTRHLVTSDVYPDHVGDEHAFAARLGGIRNPPVLRGQNIFYHGVKQQNAGEGFDAPASLYLEDPFDYAGHIRVESTDPITGELRLALTNTGRNTWDRDALGIVFVLRNDGDDAQSVLEMPLPFSVEPGGTRIVDLPIAAKRGQVGTLLSIRIMRHGRGWMTHAGIADVSIVARADALAALQAFKKKLAG